MDSALRIVTATDVGFSIMKKPCVRREDRIQTGHLLAMRRTLALLVLTGAIGALRAEEQSSSPYATAADFAKYAMKLREQALSKVEPQTFVPTSSRPAVQRYAWKTNIVTSVFWVGEKQNHGSAWDPNWQSNYGGIDNPKQSARRNYIPVAFMPRQNPFYCALPYNDLTHGQFKPEA